MSHITLKQHFEKQKSHRLHETDKMRIFSVIQQKIKNQNGILHRIRVHAKQGIILSSLGILLVGMYGPYLLQNQQDMTIQGQGIIISSPIENQGLNKASADTIGTIIQVQGAFSILSSSGNITTGVNFVDGDTIIVSANTSLGFQTKDGTIATLQGPAEIMVKHNPQTNGYTIHLLQGDNLTIQSTAISNNTKSKVDVITQDMTIKQSSDTIKLSIVRKNGRSIITNAGGQIAVKKNGSEKSTYVASNQIVEVANDVKIINNNVKQIASNFKNNSFEGAFEIKTDPQILEKIIKSDTPEDVATLTLQDTKDTSNTSDTHTLSLLATNVVSDDSIANQTHDPASISRINEQLDINNNTNEIIENNNAKSLTATTSANTDQSVLGDTKTIIDNTDLIEIESLINKTFLRNEMNDLGLRYFSQDPNAYGIALNNLSQKISRIANILDISIPNAKTLTQLSNNISILITESSKRYYISPRFFMNLGSVQSFVDDLASKESSAITQRDQENGGEQKVTIDTMYEALGTSTANYPLK